MSNEWEEAKLGDVIDIEMGQSPKSEFYNRTGEGLPFLQGNRTFGERFPIFDTYCTNNKKIAHKDEVIMSVRAPVGDLNLAQTKISIGRGVCAMRLKNNNNLYLYYLLKDNMKRLINRESGTVFGSVNKNDILGLDVKMTKNIQEQKSIAHILSTLDEKIEINNQINKKLEEMAQTIFKYWFVDFEFPNEDGEPYKSSGGEMVESEMGMIPKGWEVGTIQRLGDVIGGATPSKKKDEYFIEKGIPWITPKDLSQDKNLFISRGALDITEEAYDSTSVRKMPQGTVLFSSRAPIGYISISKNEITTNQGFKSIVPAIHKGFSSEFIYCWLKQNLEVIENRASGSTFKEISGSEMKKVPSIIPEKSILEEFKNISSDVFKEIEIKEFENRKLSNLRDILLPKLMSGEIRVPLEEGDI